MKGIILGVSYGSIFLVGTIGIVFMLPFERKLPIWNTGAFSCGFWYALSMLIVEVIVCFILVLLMRWYKQRKREDVLPNEHIFAERYYSVAADNY